MVNLQTSPHFTWCAGITDIVKVLFQPYQRGLQDTVLNQIYTFPDNNVHGAKMGPIWGRQDPGGPHAGPMNFAIWVGMM